MKKRIVSLTMVLALCLMLLPTSAFAAEDSGAAIGTGGLCAHHTEHDDTCGYVEGIAESPCTHEHSEDCYTEVTSCTHEHTGECYPASDSSIPEDGTTSSEDESVLPEAAEPTACSHVCSVESGCIKQELDCKHEHDEECGYAPAVEGQPCTYVCTLCGMTEITAWSFVDTQEVLDPDSGVLALSASAESPVPYEDIVDLLPVEIEATTENGTETLSLDSWSCDDYPEEGAYTGSYAFHAVLPEGYGLAADAPALTVTVELDDEVMLMAEGQHSHCMCGASHKDIGKHIGEDLVTFDKKLSDDSSGSWLQVGDKSAETTTIDNRTYWVLPAGSYYLDGDVHLDKSILIKDGVVNICLNGHKLYLNHGSVQIWEVIQLSGGTLNLTDCKGTGQVRHFEEVSPYGRGVTVGNGTSFTLYGGTICNNVARVSSSTTAQGGGVYIGSSSTFNMYGGKIHNNRAEDSNEPTYEFWGGGGVYCAKNGTFNLLAGEITENQVRVTKDGGNGFGGGVFNKGIFTMSGDSKISNNSITCSSPRGQYGGGVCNYKFNARFVMSGGEISGNYINSWNGGPAYGGGVYSNDTFKFTGGTITGNKVQSEYMNVYGGGVCNDTGGKFTMSGGTISNNTAKTDGVCRGGGVCIYDSTFTMSSGEISGNQALTYTASASPNSCDGGGIYFDGGIDENFTLSGGKITGNTTKGRGAGICIDDYSEHDQEYFHLSGNPVVWDNKTNDKQSNLYMYCRYDLKSPLTPGAKVGLSLLRYNNNVMVNVDPSITDDMSQYFVSDDSAYTLETIGSTIIRKSAHTHDWQFKKEDGNNSKVFVTCAGTVGTCDYQTKPATVTISTAKTVYDCAQITEAPKAVLTYSNNWPDGLAKAEESAIKYWKSTDGGNSYPVRVDDNDDLKKPGKYLAQIALVKNRYLETCFSVVDNRKQDPKYTAPTPNPGLTYNGKEQILIIKGHTEDGTMQYRLDNGTYSTKSPTAVNAGTYTVYYKVVGDASHNDTKEQSITVTIGKAPLTGTPTFTPVTEAGKTIGDVTPNVPAGWHDGVLYWYGEGEAELDSTTPIKQGASYEWFFKPADSNYQGIGGKLVLWAGTSGGSSSNPGDGNSSNTSGGGSNTGGSSSDDGNASDIGNSNSGSSNANIPPTPVTVPVSGDEKTIQVDAVVSGNTATIKNVDLSKLDTVIEDTAQNGVVTIDFSVLKKVDNVKLPSNVVKQIAEAVNEPDNDAKDLEIVLANGTSIKLDAKMLGEKNVKANGADITISIKRITGSSLNIKQKQAVGSRPALDINVTIGGKPISDMNGKVTISAAYELKPGEHASGIVVSYVDANGNRQLCETSYDPIRKQVSWKTGSLSPSSVYMIGYDESRVRAYVTYTVQKGSTLSMIAKKHGCTVADIMAANSGLIKNPNRIFVGWQLKIPQD